MSLQVIKPGIQTTVQDLGRYGFQQHGIVVSGAMDDFALRVANILVGNRENAPCLEMTLSGPELKWETDRWVAICGGDLNPVIDGADVPLWRPVYIKRHSVLTFKHAKKGCRAYLAVAGGIAVTAIMRSRSTYLRGGIGGMEGRALLAGDTLQIGDESEHRFTLHAPTDSDKPYRAMTWFASSDMLPRYSSRPVIRVIKDREFNDFTIESQHDLFHHNFKVSVQSDRMGYHLEGKKLSMKQPRGELISTAVTMGAIQVPPSGEPIVLMADRQTTGGYPIIAYVATVDLPLLAQVKPNDQIQFLEITHEQAEALYLQRERDVHMLKTAVELKVGGGQT